MNCEESFCLLPDRSFHVHKCICVCGGVYMYIRTFIEDFSASILCWKYKAHQLTRVSMAVVAPFSRSEISALIWTTTEKHGVLYFYQQSGCPQLLACESPPGKPSLAASLGSGGRLAAGGRVGSWPWEARRWLGGGWFPVFFPVLLGKSNFVVMMELSQN